MKKKNRRTVLFGRLATNKGTSGLYGCENGYTSYVKTGDVRGR